jgi:hypothetical protein
MLSRIFAKASLKFLNCGSGATNTKYTSPSGLITVTLALLLYQDVKRTFTSKLSIMLGVPKEKAQVVTHPGFRGKERREDLSEPNEEPAQAVLGLPVLRPAGLHAPVWDAGPVAVRRGERAQPRFRPRAQN